MEISNEQQHTSVTTDSTTDCETGSQQSLFTISQTTDSTPDCDTDSQQSVLTISSQSSNQNGSQHSVLTLSSEENLFVDSQSSLESTNSISSPSQTEDIQPFHSSCTRYCQGLTLLARKQNKPLSSVSEIQIYMTVGNDKRLIATKGTATVYLLCRSNKTVAMLVDRIDAGQHLLKFVGKKIRVLPEQEQDIEKVKGMCIKRAELSKYKGSVNGQCDEDSQILILGAFQKQPLTQKVISVKQSLTTKVAVLLEGLTQEQNSPVKHDQLYLHMINRTVIRLLAKEAKMRPKTHTGGDDCQEPVRQKPKFQLRIVLQPRNKKRKRSKSNSDQNSQNSLDSYLC